MILPLPFLFRLFDFFNPPGSGSFVATFFVFLVFRVFVLFIIVIIIVIIILTIPYRPSRSDRKYGVAFTA
ncbi:hypothetical protein BDV23DRAFT_148525 [Aspergillus alliaceus]|uniref:Uncharacterized protein n=1 Tax=Petromyces alliaceus TaxID=209559 RepID=A0A5N7CJM7_PETAA|nr:hypothetical protein BDV23DRAFT_148525 [Aspergillus alliaceus]